MKIYEVARNNAVAVEMKKDGLAQRQSGDWVLRFVVQAADMDQRLTNAAMGTRFQAALVEIDDNEEPKRPTDWRDVNPAAQAAIRCSDPLFRKFLAAEHGFDTQDTDQAATVVRQLCRVESRSEFSTNLVARERWINLDSQYREWAHL